MSNDTGTEEQNREAFEEWFCDTQFTLTSALLRQVFRAGKEGMWKAWMELKPWRF